MTVVSVDVSETERAALRERLRAAEDDCLVLYRLLPGLHAWSGPAGWAFGLRVTALRARIEAAHTALVAAEAQL